MNNQVIKLELTVDEVNLILEGLGNLPFKQVFALVGKIQKQAGDQLQGPHVQTDMETKKKSPQLKKQLKNE